MFVESPDLFTIAFDGRFGTPCQTHFRTVGVGRQQYITGYIGVSSTYGLLRNYPMTVDIDAFSSDGFLCDLLVEKEIPKTYGRTLTVVVYHTRAV